MRILDKGKCTSSLRDNQRTNEPAPGPKKIRPITGGRLYDPIDQKIEVIRSQAVDWVLDKLGLKAPPAFTRILHGLSVSTGGQRVPWHLMASLAQTQYDQVKGSLQIDRKPSWVENAVELRAFAAVVRNLSDDVLGDVGVARELLQEGQSQSQVLALVADRQAELLSKRIHTEWNILITRFSKGPEAGDTNSPMAILNDRPAALTRSRKDNPAKAKGLRARIGAGFPAVPGVPAMMRQSR